MRKHPRSTALLAVLFLTASMLATDVLADVRPASAHHARRPPADPTPENFERLRACESGGDYTQNTRGRYFGAYQFSGSTWRSLGYSGLAHQVAPEIQDEAAQRLQARSGWRQWPGCSRALGLR